MKTDILTANDILKIPLENPEKLYVVEDEKELKKIYRKLSMLWHPDRHIKEGSDTSPVFAHLKILYEKAIVKMESGLWKVGNILKLSGDDGFDYKLNYLKEFKFDLGIGYIGKSFVVWIFDKENTDLAENAISHIKKFSFANDKMKLEISKTLPKIKKIFKVDGKQVLIVEKDPDSICLRDVHDYYKGKLESKHVAWIISGLYNISCYFEYSHLMHGDISLDNYFINPKEHTGFLLGGWWYTHKQDEKLIALGKIGVNLAPFSMIDKKLASTILNGEMIKQVGRELLGDSTGIYLAGDKSLPKPLVSWFRDASGGNAFKEYDIWQNKVLKDSFGVRRFTEMKLTSSDIYT